MTAAVAALAVCTRRFISDVWFGDGWRWGSPFSWGAEVGMSLWVGTGLGFGFGGVSWFDVEFIGGWIDDEVSAARRGSI